MREQRGKDAGPPGETSDAVQDAAISPASSTGVTARRPRLDIRLIRTLSVLIEERSITAAADRMNETQPQVSLKLQQLREITGDALLVRVSRAMMPTAYALSLVGPVKRILADVAALESGSRAITSDFADRAFTLALPDYISAGLIGAYFSAFRMERPGCELNIHPVVSASASLKELEDGSVDVLLESVLLRSSQVRTQKLFSDHFVCLARPNHPLIGAPLQVDVYLGLAHLRASHHSSLNDGVVDRHLASLDLARNIKATTPYLNSVGETLKTTDLVFTTAAHLGRYLAEEFALQVLEPPVDFPPLEYSMQWHNRAHRSAESVWFRDFLLRVTEQYLSTQARLCPASTVPGQ
ncbi:MAG TPA: LysR family transcriptional regulator [Rhizomicrobium sp.]|nr:LysR family transcriptional regulator [Rhizomicrobium sp.]